MIRKADNSNLPLSEIQNFGKDFSPDYQIPKRTLGKTGEKLSVIGFGGIMLNDNSQEFADAMVAKAYELGVNYYDVSPKYGFADVQPVIIEVADIKSAILTSRNYLS